MGFLSRLFCRTATSESTSADKELLASLLNLERARLEASSKFDEKRQELEFKKLEMELAHLDEISSEKRKQKLFDENLKAQRREHAQKMRDAKAMKRSAPSGSTSIACEECAAIREHRSPGHSSDLIRHANENHWPEPNRGN